jgi:hypothetical protein
MQGESVAPTRLTAFARGHGVALKQRPTDCNDNDRYGNDCRNHNRGSDPSAHWHSPSSLRRERGKSLGCQRPRIAAGDNVTLGT